MNEIRIVYVPFDCCGILQCFPYPGFLYASARASLACVICENEIHNSPFLWPLARRVLKARLRSTRRLTGWISHRCLLDGIHVVGALRAATEESCKLQVTSAKEWFGCSFWEERSGWEGRSAPRRKKAASLKFQVPSRKGEVASHKLQVASCKLQVRSRREWLGCSLREGRSRKLQVSSCKFQVKSPE